MVRSLIASFVLLNTACSSPAFDVAPSSDATPNETTSSESGADGGPEAPIDTNAGADSSETSAETASDAGMDGEPETDAPATGVGLPCTNMEQCGTYGLACISGPDPTCTAGDSLCPRRYTCRPHPAGETCDPPDGHLTDGGRVDPWDCRDVHCVTVADCPAGSNFCVALTWTAADDSCRVLGIERSICSSGTPAIDPVQVCHATLEAGPGPFGYADTLYTCAGDGDCIMSDGDGGTTTGTCCSTSVGIRYCASACTLG